MGLWVQNVGVAAPELPAEVQRLADSERYGLPDETIAGWSWLTLREMLSLDDFQALMKRVAGASGAPAIGFSVHDDDSVVVMGAAPTTESFALVMDARAFNQQELGITSRELGAGGAAAFAEWTARYAPRAVDVADVRRVSRRASVYRLLALAGLFPEPPPRPPWTDWFPKRFHGACGFERDDVLVGRREYALLPEPEHPFVGPPGPWLALVVEMMGLRKSSVDANPIRECEELSDWVVRLQAHEEPVELVCLMIPAKGSVYMPSRDETASFEDGKVFISRQWRYGRELGEWAKVPDEVPLSRLQTVTWVLGELGIEVTIRGADR